MGVIGRVRGVFWVLDGGGEALSGRGRVFRIDGGEEGVEARESALGGSEVPGEKERGEEGETSRSGERMAAARRKKKKKRRCYCI